MVMIRSYPAGRVVPRRNHLTQRRRQSRRMRVAVRFHPSSFILFPIMPSRIVCLGIILVWLGFNGWLFFRDLLPRLMPGQPPPYTIDIVEETKTRRPYV